jgi:hypothetical protein
VGRTTSAAAANSGTAQSAARAVAAAADAVAAIPNRVPLTALTRNHETKAAEPPDMMGLSVSEWSALKTAVDKLEDNGSDKPSQLYFGKKLNLKSTQVKILCTEARVPTAPAQVLNEDEYYSIIEHIQIRADEIEHYVKARDDAVKQLAASTGNNSTNSSSSSSGDATAVSEPVAVLSTSSERSTSSHHGVCSVRQRELEHATSTAASTTAVGTNATEYRYECAANGASASDTQQHSDTIAASYSSDGYKHNRLPQQVLLLALQLFIIPICARRLYVAAAISTAQYCFK